MPGYLGSARFAKTTGSIADLGDALRSFFLSLTPQRANSYRIQPGITTPPAFHPHIKGCLVCQGISFVGVAPLYN